MPEPNSGCWLWTGKRLFDVPHRSYGRYKNTLAHRLVYQLCVGPIPIDREVEHTCQTPPCVNPAHIRAATHRENMLRGGNPWAVMARRDTCAQGHPFTRRASGLRECRICINKKYNERWHAKKDERKKRMRPLQGCPGYSRHWFTVYGEVGNKTTTCARCGVKKDPWPRIYSNA